MGQAIVIGFGVSGKASAQLLLSKGFQVEAVDRKWETLQNEIVKVRPDQPDAPVSQYNLAVLSPGIDPSHPLVKKIREAGIETIGEIELALRYLPNRKIIGVTGSNGKTTTVLLTAHALLNGGMPARAVGNVGAALSGYALHPNPDEILIVELSSFQLETLPLRPFFDVGAILNITPNHLNRHASMEEYALAKLRLQGCLKEGGKFFVSEQVKREYRVENSTLFTSTGQFENGVRQGLPEKENIGAAKALTAFCGLSDAAFQEALFSFRKPPHRIEWVDEIDGVAYYNDSKASNVEAVMHAVRLFEGPLILLAGGVDKGSSYAPWIASFQGKVKKIAVFGEAAEKMERELSPYFAVERAANLEEAVAIAKQRASASDTVLLSPGCSSYDQFANYEERGDAFKQLVRRR